MAAALALMAIVGVAFFGVTVLAMRSFKVRQLSRKPVRGATVRVDGRALVSFGLLLSGVWVSVSAGVILVVYTTVLPAVVVGVLVFLMVLLRPVIQTRGQSVFSLRYQETVGQRLDEGRNDLVKDGAHPGIEKRSVVVTERDIELGARANKVAKVLGVCALILTLGIAIFVLVLLPLDTRLAYSGRLGRNGIPMPIAVAIIPLAIFLTIRPVLKPKSDIDHMNKGDRVIIYWIGVPMFLFFLYGQWVIAESMLSDAGVLG